MVEFLLGECEEFEVLLEEYYVVDLELFEDVVLKVEFRRLESSRVVVEMCGFVILIIAGECGVRGLFCEVVYEVKGLIVVVECCVESVSLLMCILGDEDLVFESELGFDEASL